MKQRIIENITNPDSLEKLYRDNKQDFYTSFTEISDNYDSELVKFWRIRLNPEAEANVKAFVKQDLLVVILLSLFTGLLAKIPAIFPGIEPQSFYQRNLPIIVFNGLILYVFWQSKIFDKKRIAIYGGVILLLTLFVNFLPDLKGDSSILALIHSPLFLWCLFGIAYISFDYRNTGKRIGFIRFNGEYIVMTGLILIAGGIMSAMTINLFSLIKMDILALYRDYVIVFGGVAIPIVSFYIVKLYPTITSKIAPVIARVFAPLVLIILIVYLISMVFSATNILEDRELLILFNAMLIAVLAIIVFSITELDKTKKKDGNVLVLLLLASLASIVDILALAAIMSRLSTGFTPNRTAVVVSNILIFVNLILIARSLFKSYFKSERLDSVEQVVAKYLPIYFVWTIIVIVIFPFLFGFK